MTGTTYDRIPKNWRVVKDDGPLTAWRWLKSHENEWTEDAAKALALTKAEAAGFAAFFGAVAVEL